MACPKANGTKDSSAHLGFEAKLWLAADKLRNNMDAAEYNPRGTSDMPIEAPRAPLAIGRKKVADTGEDTAPPPPPPASG